MGKGAQEGRLADIICDLCNAPSQVAKEFKSVAVDGSQWFPRQLKQKHRCALVERIWLFSCLPPFLLQHPPYEMCCGGKTVPSCQSLAQASGPSSNDDYLGHFKKL